MMPAKLFNFSVVEMKSGEVAAFSAEADTLAAAFAAGAKSLPVVFASKPGGALRMFRFRFENSRTGEFSAVIGQGETALEGFSDAIKNTRETFRSKADGKQRDSNGLPVLLPARPGDIFARGRVVSRSVEGFQSDETYDQERRRVRLEEERKRLQAGGLVA